MALRDVEFYFYLKEALKEKLRHPDLESFRLGKYNFAYDYIFDQARRVFPQKYHFAHTYFNGVSIAQLYDEHKTAELKQLNMEFAQDLVQGFGGLDETKVKAQDLDPVLAEYEKELTAPEEPDSFHNELKQNQLPTGSEQEPGESGQEPGGQGESSGNQPAQRTRNEPRRIIIQKPGKPQYGMTKEEYAKYKAEHKEERDAKARELWAQRKKERDSSEEDEDDEKKKRLRREGEKQATGKNPLANRLNNWLKNKFNNTRLGRWLSKQGKAFSNSGLGKFLNRLNAPFRWLGNVTGYTRLNNFLSGIGKNLSSWAGNTLRSLASQAGRFLLNGASRVLANLGSQAAGGAARTAAMTAGRGALLLLANPITWIVIGVAGLFLFTWWYDNLIGNSECNKPEGVMKIVKGADNIVRPKLAYENGEQINYVIQVTYELACRTRTLPSVVVTDKIPTGTKLVAESAKSGFYNTRGTGPDGVYDDATRTVTWTFQNFPTDNPAYIFLSVQPDPDKQDFWAVNEATVKYTLDRPSGGNFQATQDNCNGTYQLTNPLGNFGDPSCIFKKDDLYTLLKQQDSTNADYWFYQVVRCESGYNPNSWRDPNITPKTPDPAGAWGLYQMGRGRNGQYDHGDVPWQQQTTNAVNYSKGIISIGAYWACAREDIS
ncbi:MAG: hypothetical protein HYS83_01715 [Candidatus Blackburnbacteria bacterium]|nr:hypothetical protein [Candidatus Blackburnbacteria bacterium]